MKSIAINGFGRIGRHILRAFLERPKNNIAITVINSTSNAQNIVHLLTYDSVHGRLQQPITYGENWIVLQNQKIALSFEKDPEKILWNKYDVDIVLECTGRFTNKKSATKHLQAGAKKVLISAPGKNVDFTIVYGVNHHILQPSHRIVANASCTTNCLAPIVKILHDNWGIAEGFMTTIHAYTNDQRLVDATHTDLRRARSANLSIIPTSTGAAQTIDLIIPDLSGKLDGIAFRVPTPNVSLVDLSINLNMNTTIDDINHAFIQAEKTNMKNILATNTLPLVSSDFCHTTASSIVDLDQTRVINKKFARVAAWYDNEWAFAHRMLDVAELMAKI